MLLKITSKNGIVDEKEIDKFTLDEGGMLVYWPLGAADDAGVRVSTADVRTVEVLPVPISTTVIINIRQTPEMTARLRARYGDLPVEELMQRAWHKASYLDA